MKKLTEPEAGVGKTIESIHWDCEYVAIVFTDGTATVVQFETDRSGSIECSYVLNVTDYNRGHMRCYGIISDEEYDAMDDAEAERRRQRAEAAERQECRRLLCKYPELAKTVVQPRSTP